MRAAEQKAIFALIGQRLVAEQRADVEPDILGIVRQGVGEFLERHRIFLSAIGGMGAKKRARRPQSSSAPLMPRHVGKHRRGWLPEKGIRRRA